LAADPSNKVTIMTVEGVVPARLGIVVAMMFAAGIAMAAGPELAAARKLYNSTDFEQSLKVLQAIPSKDGPVYELMGRDYYMRADYKRATEVLEKAVAMEPANAEYALWLGRAWGRRAETSTPFTAPSHASKARQYFEKSVQLNPTNLEAQSDLFEYYLEAPGFLGGGLDKAEATAAQLGRISPSEGQWAEAKLAEKRKELGSAEAHLRRAIELAPQQVGKLIELARFLTKQGRYQEADQSFERAEKVAPNSARVVFARAETYVKAHRNLEVAKQLLKHYMSMDLNAEDPPRSEAAKLLREAQGD
jgi:tetratricopeptide (TPR) repeat protein